jgi:hypothetical protein
MSALQERYENVVRDIAASYRAKGYAVRARAKVPTDDGRQLEVDLLAERGAETVLVEVRLTNFAGSQHALRDYADLAHRKGWRFVIAVADSKNVEEVEVPAPQAVRARITEARKLDLQSDAALLMAWAVLEAAARLALAKAGHRVVRSKAPTALVQELASLGRITPQEERDLMAFAAKRNRLAHGFWEATTAPIGSGQVLAVAERLLEDGD